MLRCQDAVALRFLIETKIKQHAWNVEECGLGGGMAKTMDLRYLRMNGMCTHETIQLTKLVWKCG